MTAPTRRAALGAILAAPLASVPALARTATMPDHEARLLAIGPRLVAMLDEYDRLWAPVSGAFASWDAASERLASPLWPAQEELPEWAAYKAARRPADDLAEVIEELYEPFFDLPMTTLPAIMLVHRYGMTFDACRDDALNQLDRLWREASPCA